MGECVNHASCWGLRLLLILRFVCFVSLGVQSLLGLRIQSGVASVNFCSPRHHDLAILFAIRTHLTIADFTASATFMVRPKSMITVSSKKSPGFRLITAYMVPAKYRNQTYLQLHVMLIKNVQN